MIKVTFQKEAQNSNGKAYWSPLGTFSFKGRRISRNEAIERAINLFEVKCEVDCWKEIADTYEVLG